MLLAREGLGFGPMIPLGALGSRRVPPAVPVAVGGFNGTAEVGLALEGVPKGALAGFNVARMSFGGVWWTGRLRTTRVRH